MYAQHIYSSISQEIFIKSFELLDPPIEKISDSILLVFILFFITAAVLTTWYEYKQK